MIVVERKVCAYVYTCMSTKERGYAKLAYGVVL